MTPELSAAATTATDAAHQRLIRLSHELHAHPELGFEEERACGWVGEALAEGGFTVETGVAALPTALRARSGSGPLNIAICAEYDALPGVGHACGHNVIAAAAVGTAIALKPLADELGITINVFGTPAEENGGGKVLMLERGAFDGMHVAMMVHPSPEEHADPPTLAIAHLEAVFTGRDAHASAYPEDGVNAADAITVAQVGIGLLRQHLRADDRVHGIVTHGGDAPNITPGRTTAAWYVRSSTLARLADLEPRIRACLEAGALATGCTVELSAGCPAYSEAAYDPDLIAAYVAAAHELGRAVPSVVTEHDRRTAGSTDMANVSLALPSIQPMIAIESGGVGNHHPDFAAACVNPSADLAIRDGAIGMALAAIEAATNGRIRERLLAAA